MGIFEANADISDAPANLGAEGKAGVDPGTGNYVVIGSGNDIWNNADNFHFLYREISGDFNTEANVDADAGTSANEWVKAMLMARDELDAASVNYGILIRTDGLINPQWRPTAAAASVSLDTALRVTLQAQEGRLRLERSGDHFTAYYLNPNTGEWVLYHEMDLVMEDPIYIGLAVTSHEVNALSVGKFWDVDLTINGEPVSVADWALY